MENYSDLDYEGSGLELVHVSDVLDYLGKYITPLSMLANMDSIKLSSCFSLSNIQGTKTYLIILRMISCDSWFKFLICRNI